MKRNRMLRIFTQLTGVAVTALLFSMVAVPTALANDQEEEFDMNDRLATEKGASGIGKTAVNGDSVEFEVKAEGLLPNQQYELRITFGTAGLPPVPGNLAVVSCGPVTSIRNGDAKFRCDVDLVQLVGPGAYRLDLFITRIRPTVAGSGATGIALSGVLGRDPLLACQPAPMVMVPGTPMDPGAGLDVPRLETQVEALAEDVTFLKDVLKRVAARLGVLRRVDVDK